MQSPKRKILFLINPVSGIGNKAFTRKLIEKYIDKEKIEYSVVDTLYPGHGTRLARSAKTDGLDAVIVAGGDGSVREVAEALVNSPVKLGIIPNGSGNGLARHLGIPLNEKKSLQLVNQFRHKAIDTYTINGIFGCNLSGLGFDAAVAQEFAKMQKRGFLTYLRIVLKRFSKSPAYDFAIIKPDGTSLSRKALLIAIANSNQFGSGVSIAPEAKSDDQILDICIMKKKPLIISLWVGVAMLFGFIHKTGFVEYIRVDEVQIKSNIDIPLHIDGEAFPPARSVDVKINPLSLNVIS